MKRSLYMIISVFVLSLATVGAVWAAESKEEMGLQKEAAAINTAAGSAEGEKVVTHRLEKEFNVTDAQIQAMRDKKMGYGEIAIALSFCRNMPGGATDANIQQVMTMRQGPPTMGWGNVAKNLGTRLGPAISHVRNVRRESTGEMKRESKGDTQRMEKHQKRRDERHKESMGHENMGGGQGMSHGKGK